MQASVHGDIQEGGGVSEPKPSSADETIEILVSAYKSSDTSEIAIREMHNIHEMVGIRTLQQAYFQHINVGGEG
jgi:hypothetical protein